MGDDTYPPEVLRRFAVHPISRGEKIDFWESQSGERLKCPPIQVDTLGHPQPGPGQ